MDTQQHTLQGALSESTDPMLLLQRIVVEVLALLANADGSAIEVADEDAMTCVCAAGTLAAHVNTRVPLERSLSGLAASTGHTMKSDDSETDARVDLTARRKVGAASMLCVPLVRGGTCVGVLKATASEPAAFSDTDVALLQTVAPFIATAVGAAWDISDMVNGLLVFERPAHPLLAGLQRAVQHFLANVLRPGMVGSVEMHHRITAALKSEYLYMLCQPVIDLTDGRMVAAEALARFPVSDALARTPDLWFADAHAVGLGVELELVALKSALTLVSSLPVGVNLAVNIGPAALATGEAAALMEQAGPERVVIELTEHAPVEDYPGLFHMLQRLRAQGASLAIDDTGAGISSLAHILELAPDYIKLDRQLTHGIETDPVRRALADALVTFAAETGARVVAEGIENEAALQTLKALGIPYGQGFHLGFPEPVQRLHHTVR